MVYQGKPSSGCATCRKRKIKCDEGLPACSQCTNTKRECPGYIARFDLLLRDETKSVRRKAQKKRQQSTPAPRAKSPYSISFKGSAPKSTYALAGPGEGPSYAVMKKSEQASEDVPRIFNDFPEQQAICAFFLDFVLLPRHPDSVRGHLEHLLPLYKDASPDSPLSLATSSVALAISSGSPLRRKDRQLGQAIFGRALRRTSAAIQDPAESVRDETLMAVLLLGLFERINATAETSKLNLTSTHNAGAAALIQHRGQANCRSPLAIGLTFAVRTQLVEHAIETDTAFKRCPDGLTNIFKTLPQNAAARLTSATINIADLRSSAKSALPPQTPASEPELTNLIEYAISIDLLVSAWPHSLPADWKWSQATAFDHPTPKAAYAYQDRVDVYLDLWVESIWNQYRAARIKIHSTILSLISRLPPSHQHIWYWRSVYAAMVTQHMADEICASVPYALGTKWSGGPEEVEFPYVGKVKASGEHRRASAALGGWHLLDPLKTCLRAGGLRVGQREWVVRQMQRIGRIYLLEGEGEGEMGERFSFEFPL